MNNIQRSINSEIDAIAVKEEDQFLSLLLKDKDSLMDAISSGLQGGSEGHLMGQKSQLLFAVMEKYYKKHQSTLTISALESILETDALGRLSDEDKAAIKTYWHSIWTSQRSDLEDYGLLKENINHRYRQYQAISILKSDGNALSKSKGNQSETLDEMVEKLQSIENLQNDPYNLSMQFDDGVDKAMDYIKDMRDNPDSHRGILTGIKGIDNVFHGFAPGSYTVISGMINGGKTTLMMNMAMNVAKMGKNVIYVSLEKEADVFFRRLLCLHALTNYSRTKVGGRGKYGLSDYWYQKLAEAAKDIKENIKPHLICYQFVAQTKISEILNGVDNIHRRTPTDLLLVDYLQVIGFETHHSSRPDIDLAFVHQTLMAYGQRNRIATITALQLKNKSTSKIREQAKKAEKDNNSTKIEINTEDFSGSQKVIADADNAIAVVLNEGFPRTQMTAIVSKARDDQSKIHIPLVFDGNIGRVGDPEIEPGQVTAVDDLIYGRPDLYGNDEVPESAIMSDDGLFSSGDNIIDEFSQDSGENNNVDNLLGDIKDTVGGLTTELTPETTPKPEDKPEPTTESEPEDDAQRSSALDGIDL